MCMSERNYVCNLNCGKHENIAIAHTFSGKTLQRLKYEVRKMFRINPQYCICLN